MSKKRKKKKKKLEICPNRSDLWTCNHILLTKVPIFKQRPLMLTNISKMSEILGRIVSSKFT